MVVERKRYGIKSSMMQSSYLSEARGNLGMQNGNTKRSLPRVIHVYRKL